MKKILFALCALFGTASFSQTPDELQPTDSQALVEVIVVNANLKSQEGEKISFVSVKTGKAYEGTTNEDGKFKVLVPKDDKYKIRYKNFTDDKEYTTMNVPAKPDLIDIEYTIKVNRPKVFTLENVFFDTGKTTLRPESNKGLNELAEFMKRKKKMQIEIAGHSDNVGDQAANEKLSQGRSESVRAFLIKKGIAPERVTAKGYGDSQPVADNATPEGRQKNRRTEVRVVSE
jgi:OOP family OmpA-OmpF porin